MGDSIFNRYSRNLESVSQSVDHNFLILNKRSYFLKLEPSDANQ